MQQKNSNFQKKVINYFCAHYVFTVFALAKAFNVTSDISIIARQGSGSACRSMFGGFVQWYKGEEDDGTDSITKQLFTENHWPELRVLILVVSICNAYWYMCGRSIN